MNFEDNKKEYVFGIHPVLEALDSEQEVEKILIQKGMRTEMSKRISDEARKKNIPISVVPVEKLNRVTRKNHQGVIAFISAIQYASLDNVIDQCYSTGQTPLFLLLDQITDVRNFGAIARTAEAAGVHTIIVPSKGSALITSDAVRTSAGALNHIPVCRVKDLGNTIKYLKDSGFKVIGASEKGKKSVFESELTSPLSIVMGSEEKGISEQVLELCHDQLHLPMKGKVGSLNVSVAASIFIFEAVRQRVIVE